MVDGKRRLLIGALALIACGMTLAACGDDDDDATPTATSAAVATPSAVTTAQPAASPTPTGDFITIDEPAASATVWTPFVMSGEADVFEAALTVDVLDVAGATLCVRHIMASSGTGTPGTWETTLPIPPPDAVQDVTVRAYSFSAMDGSMINLVEHEVTLGTERPSIFITAPACGATVAPGATLAVTGRAAVFEAALTVELRDASGAAVVTQSVMAASGVEESDFSATLTIPATLSLGFYDLVAFNHSALDGSIENEFSMQVVVEP